MAGGEVLNAEMKSNMKNSNNNNNIAMMIVRSNNNYTNKNANSMVLLAHSQTGSDLNWLIKGLYSDVLPYGMCTLLAAASTAPLDLLATYVTSSGFNLEWSPPSSPNGNIDSYQLKLFTENSLHLLALNAVNVNSTAYNYTGLAPFTGYSVQVCAYTGACGDIATLNVTTLGGERAIFCSSYVKHET